jgi:hypothetical protein
MKIMEDIKSTDKILAKHMAALNLVESTVWYQIQAIS